MPGSQSGGRLTPPSRETVGVEVIKWVQAPLTFLNTLRFPSGFAELDCSHHQYRVVLFESNAIVEIDYTAAQVLSSVGATRLADVAFARLESVHAEQSPNACGLPTVGAIMCFAVEGAVMLGPQALPSIILFYRSQAPSDGENVARSGDVKIQIGKRVVSQGEAT
jgi:MFS superfamily sulfate permease-like transporter